MTLPASGQCPPRYSFRSPYGEFALLLYSLGLLSDDAMAKRVTTAAAVHQVFSVLLSCILLGR